MRDVQNSCDGTWAVAKRGRAQGGGVHACFAVKEKLCYNEPIRCLSARRRWQMPGVKLAHLGCDGDIVQADHVIGAQRQHSIAISLKVIEHSDTAWSMHITCLQHLGSNAEL